MKHLLHKTKWQHLLLYITCTAGTLLLIPGCNKEITTQQAAQQATHEALAVSPIATGLKNPIGLEIDKNGWVWIAQSGTGSNDGKVSVLTQDGKLYDAITDFESVIDVTGDPDGPTHLLFADGLLYILGTGGKMYKADVTAFKPGSSPVKASSLAVEDIGAFVLAYNFVNNAHDTHPYNLTLGPNGDIYIADAAANAILRREKNGTLSVVAEVPGIANPTPVGPPALQSVPTGIYFDGHGFLVTTLLGFPFPAGKAIVYSIVPAASGPGATVTVFQQGFNSLVDIAAGAAPGRLVLEHATFGATGFLANTGRLLWANGTTMTVLAEGLNKPVGIKQVDEHTWYVTSLGDNSLLKITY